MSKDKFIKYITSEKRLSEHTIRSYQSDLDQFMSYLSIEFDITDNFNEINFQLIRSWIVYLLERNIQPRTVNRKISVLKTFFKFLLREHIIRENPMLRIVSPKSKKRLPVFVEKEEIKILLDKIEFEQGFVGDRDKLIIEFFYVTGVRLSELINIKINDIDFYNNTVKVLGKRNKERIIPLSSIMISQIMNFIKKYNITLFLFTHKRRQVYSKLVYRVVKKYLSKISSVDQRGPHILRHTFATHMLNNGADINAIKELLGHANLSATQIYTHNTIEKLKLVYKQAHPRA